MPIIIATLLALLLSVNGCALQERIQIDAAKARELALRANDTAGARCWAYVEAQLADDALTKDDFAGVLSAVQLARSARIKAPQQRAEISAACGEVMLDALIEIGKRARR